MDQVKEILRQAIKHRFWIVVGISALLPMIGYALGSGPIKDKTKKETEKIKGAEKGVQAYRSGQIPNDQYKPLVDEKKDLLSKDVNASWKKLYQRQEPFLTWPENVKDKFQAWGREWPKDVDPSVVHQTIFDYVLAYRKYVEGVYKTCRPFDPIEGTGVVSAPPEEALLRPAPFTIETPPGPPTLGKVWAAQERLWIQRTLLQVVDDVNAKAKDWDSAIIKQIDALEVGNMVAQDQVSIGEGETLEEAPELDAPGAEGEEAPAEEESSEGGMMGGPMPGMMRGGFGGGIGQNAEQVFYLKPKSETSQFKILPFQLSVLIDQDHIQDLFVAFENSPMGIQAAEMELSKPLTRVVKPEKGLTQDYMGGFMGMGGMGMNSMMHRQMMGQMGRRGMGQMTGFGGPMMSRQMMDMYAGGAGRGGMMAAASKSGVDTRNENRAEKKKAELEQVTKSVVQSMNDPYFYIVKLTVYGQARFYNPPPADAPAEPSQSEEAPAADGETAAPKAEPAKAEGEAAEAPKAEGATPEAKAEAPKADADAAKAPEAKTETTPKAEAPEAKAEAPRAEAPEAKAEAPKAEASAPKPETAPEAATPKK